MKIMLWLLLLLRLSLFPKPTVITASHDQRPTVTTKITIALAAGQAALGPEGNTGQFLKPPELKGKSLMMFAKWLICSPTGRTGTRRSTPTPPRWCGTSRPSAQKGRGSHPGCLCFLWFHPLKIRSQSVVIYTNDGPINMQDLRTQSSSVQGFE